jgi:hypothetical protein
MERIPTTDNNRHDDLISAEPHFIDERTVRSARPVVPLETVNKERRRRRLMLGGAFIIACLLGSTAAVALIRLRQPSVISDATDATTAEAANKEKSEEQALKTSETETVEVAYDTASSDAEDSVADAEPKKEKRKKKSDKHASGVRITISTSPASANGQARLVGQWEEKRQRRVSRERDPQQNHHRSDLFRIREIFEGPRRTRRANN